MNCKLQMGGSDQWGNIVTGTELIRKKSGGEAFAFTCPLIKKADGGKFGKSEQGNVWLDAEKTSPYQFYQFWLNATDKDAESWIKIFTFLTKDEIDNIIVEHKKDESKWLLQKTLAKELTIFVHGKSEFDKAIETTQKLFAEKNATAESLSEHDLNAINGIVKAIIKKEDFEASIDVTTLFSDLNIFDSKGNARKMIADGGVSINKEKITDPKMIPTSAQLLHGKFLLVQKGKKNFYLIEVE